ncbi:MAG: hydantoinase B/oxoprolinase family protein, partial [Caldilineaceae bacterium]|nr:hydantoinase B/oxoprolinase family protein [Caldilineaceae bacterium]
VDKITVEVIRNYLITIADEMKKVIERTSMSPIIYEVLDFSTGVFTRESKLIGQAAGLTMFLGTLDLAVEATLRKFGADGLHPGDLIITNDPYDGGGTHLNDVVTISPIFYQGKLAAFSAVRAHWIDLGGKVPFSQMSDATEIFQEGLVFPVVKLYDRGVLNQALYDVILSNVRIPASVGGDLQSQVAACRIAERRITELLDKYGVDTFDAAVAQILANSEVQIREAIRQIPDGVYAAEDFADAAGPGGDPIRVAVEVRVDGDEITFDFTGTDAATASSFNQGWGALLSCCRAMLKCITTPQDPTNDGSFRALHVVAPEGCCLNVKRPSPVCMYGELGMHVMDAIWKALAPVLPDKLPAGHYSTVAAQGLAGYDTGTSPASFFMFGGPNGGGWGAGKDWDGENALICLGDGDTRNTPMEVIEAKYPIQVLRYALIPDSGGAGEFRGGLGLEVVYRMLRGDALSAVFVSGRCKFPAFGLFDGNEGLRSAIFITRDGEQGPCTCQAAGLPLQVGDEISVIAGGGGGWGDPSKRDPERLRRDVELGYVTEEAAREIYEGLGTGD